MKPAIGTAWRRKPDIPRSKCCRFEKCKVVEPTDELVSDDDVLIVEIGTPQNWDHWPMAMNAKQFLEEYEPLQTSLF